jgi:hypothetical protein
MTSSSRLLVLLCFCLAALAAPAGAAEQGAIAVTASETAFSPLQPGRARFGRLEFLGGLRLQSDDPRFGGFSGLALSADGSRLVAVSDDGWLLTATLAYAGPRIAGVGEATLEPLLGPDGKRPAAKWRRDAEALAVWDDRGLSGPLIVGYESRPRLELVDPRGKRRTQRLSIPDALRRGPANGELEAVARVLDGPRRGSLIALSERNLDAAGNIRGWLWNEHSTVEIALPRHDDYVITGMAFLPGGERFVTVERSFSPPTPPGMAVRLFDLAGHASGRPLAGEVLFEGRQPLYAIDNMEGIAVHRAENGALVVTVISDDNYNRTLQRTILLQFALAE